jgi:putative oxidoreductase
VRYFGQILGLPAVVVFLVIATELLGGAALVVGLLGRVAALAVAVLMAGAAITVHLPHGFFMNWFGSQKGEGWECHLLALAMSAVIVLSGSGAWSLDGMLSRRFGRRLARTASPAHA